MLCLAALPAVAQDGGAGPKWIGPPEGDGPRITIQITPEDIARQRGGVPGVRAAPPATVEAAAPAPYAWFWRAVSPAAEDAAPGRLAPALAALDTGEVAAPRLSALQSVVQNHGAAILGATAGTRVSPALVLAVMAVESGGAPAAVSRAGAEGLMQLMPATAARFGVADSFDAAENIRGGVAYLDWLMAHFGGDPILALAGYNAGEGAVRDHAGVPPFAETRAYVPKVLAAYRVARGLCRRPPAQITDGCVFVTGDA